MNKFISLSGHKWESSPFLISQITWTRLPAADREIVKAAADSGRPLREVALEHGVDEEILDKALDLRTIAAGVRPD